MTNTIGPWVPYTPIVSSVTGALTSYTSDGSYILVGSNVFIKMQVQITDGGTGATGLLASLPFDYNFNGAYYIFPAYEFTTNKACTGTPYAPNTILLSRYDGAYTGATSNVIQASGFYTKL